MTDPATYINGRTVQEQMNSLIGYVDSRSAEVALDAIAADVAQVHQDMLDADADATAAAASAAAAAGTLANAVKKTGEASQTIQGDVAVTGALAAGATSLGGNTTIAGDLGVVGDLSVSSDATLSGVTSVITEATGTFSNQAANSLKLKNELDAYAPMVRNTGNIKISGSKQYQESISRGCTSADMMTNPATAVGATIMSFVDLMNGDTHNTLGSMTKVRNTANQNYLDLSSVSYGFTEGGVQQRLDVFLRLLINDSTGDAQLILYRSKRNADGTGTTDVKSKVLANITAAGVVT